MYDFALDPATDVPIIVKQNARTRQKWSELGPLPVPDHGAVKVSIGPTLKWARVHTAGSDSVTSYKVLFGTTNLPQLADTTSAQTFSTGSLNSGMIFYWKVDQVKSCQVI
jgi:hypothetical protein